MDERTKIQVVVLRSGLKLEIKGLKRSRGPSAYTLLKRILNIRGNKESVLIQTNQWIEDNIPSLKSDPQIKLEV